MSGLRMHTGVVKIHTNPSCELRIFANVNLANKSVLWVYLKIDCSVDPIYLNQ